MSPATAVAPIAAKGLSLTSRAFYVSCTPAPVRVGQMRRITAAFLQKWEVRGALAENIVLVVSELVTNAVEHGTGDALLRVLHHDGEVRIEVTDDNPTPAEMRTAGDEDESGRGLLLTTVLAGKWGVSDSGRTTWARFRVPAGRS